MVWYPKTVIIRTIFFCYGVYGVVMDWPRAFNPLLVLCGIEDFVDGEPLRSEVLFEDLEQIR